MTKTVPVVTAGIRRIVRDLTEKYPAGPRGVLTKNHYVSTSVWSDAYRREVPGLALRPDLVGRVYITEANIKHFGYEPLELFKLGINSEETSKELIKSLYPSLTRPSITRKGRLLYTRIREARMIIMRDGTEGIWSVSSYAAPYGSLWRNMEIFGANRADVESQVRLIGPMTGLSPDWRIDVKFARLGNRDEATQSAARLAAERVNRIKREIESHRTHIAKLEKELESETQMMNRNLGGVMLLAGTDIEEQEAVQ